MMTTASLTTMYPWRRICFAFGDSARGIALNIGGVEVPWPWLVHSMF
jgi:hypothetical protein